MSQGNKSKHNKHKLIVNILDITTFVLAFLFLFIVAYILAKNTETQPEMPKNEHSIKDVFRLENESQEPLYTNVSETSNSKTENEFKIINHKTQIQDESEVKVNVFPYYEHIPLEEETQRFIWEKSIDHDLNYELVIGVIKTESDFNPKVVSYNGSSVGLMQINQYDTLDWLAEEVGLSNVNPYNPKHSIEMGTWYLAYLKQYWIDRGVKVENAQKAALISYHRGLNGAKKYIKNNGFNSKYTKKVLNYKQELEGI